MVVACLTYMLHNPLECVDLNDTSRPYPTYFLFGRHIKQHRWYEGGGEHGIKKVF